MYKIKKVFCKDFNVPIPTFDDKEFFYFLDIYEMREKYIEFEKMVKEVGEKEFLDMRQNLISSSIERFKSYATYRSFNECDMDKFQLNENFEKINLYRPENNGKTFLSIDICNANSYIFHHFFSLLVTYSDLIYLSCKWNDVPVQFTEYFQNSKYIRQNIFGNLNPKRQQKMQKYLIFLSMEKLKEKGIYSQYLSSDEIIIDLSYNPWGKFTSEELNEIFPFDFKLEYFTLKELNRNRKIYLKGDKIVGCPKYLYAQYFKFVNKKGIIYNDLFFEHDKIISSFCDIDNELKKYYNRISSFQWEYLGN